MTYDISAAFIASVAVANSVASVHHLSGRHLRHVKEPDERMRTRPDPITFTLQREVTKRRLWPLSMVAGTASIGTV